MGVRVMGGGQYSEKSSQQPYPQVLWRKVPYNKIMNLFGKGRCHSWMSQKIVVKTGRSTFPSPKNDKSRSTGPINRRRPRPLNIVGIMDKLIGNRRSRGWVIHCRPVSNRRIWIAGSPGRFRRRLGRDYRILIRRRFRRP